MTDHMNRHKIYPAPDHPTAQRVDNPPGNDSDRTIRNSRTVANQCAACGKEMPEGDQVCKQCIGKTEARQQYLDGFRDGYNRGIASKESAPNLLPKSRQAAEKVVILEGILIPATEVKRE